MARAKHRDIIRAREQAAFVRRHERAEAHDALLKQHKEWKKRKRQNDSSVSS